MLTVSNVRLVTVPPPPPEALVGAVAATSDPGTFAATGCVGVVGSVAAQSEAGSCAASGGPVVTGEVTATSVEGSFSAAGTPVVSAVMAASSEAGTFSATGAVYAAREAWGEGLRGNIEWVDASHVRVTYDWLAETQLLDWVPYPNSAVCTPGAVELFDVQTDMNGLIWKGALAASLLTATITWAGGGATGALLHVNRAANWSKSNWTVNPMSGHYQETGGTSLWLSNGASDWHNSHGSLSGTTHTFDLTTVGTALQARSDSGPWCTSTFTHNVPRLDGHIAVGVKDQLCTVGPIVIEGEVDGWLPDVGEIGVAHNGQVFAPVITLHDGFTLGVNATVLWTFDDETTSESLTPSKDFGSAALHHTRLRVTPWEALRSLVTGYDGADGGPVGDPRLPTVDGELNAVSRLWSLPNATALTALGLSYATIQTVNLSGMTALDDLECYQCANLAHVDLSGCASLYRCCLEQCYLRGTLDLSDCPALHDLRGAVQGLTEILYHSEADPWHICVRGMLTEGGPLIPSPMLWPALGELLIYQTRISVPVVPHTSVGLTVMASSCPMPSIDLQYAPLTHWVEINNCGFDEAQVDLVLAQLASGTVSGGTLDLRNNTAPSVAGQANAAILTGRSWTVYHD